MTNEDKQLLLKVLCTGLPYNICVLHDYGKKFDSGLICYLSKIDLENKQLWAYGVFEPLDIENIKPYLRPMSSMTDEEMDKLFDILHIDKNGNDEDWIKINDVVGIKFFFPSGKWVENVAETYDYLNSIHIDYRGLIPMGLALEAPRDMYKTE